MMFVAKGYNGIDTREVGRAGSRVDAERLIEEFKRDLVRRTGGVFWPMFWIEEE